MPISKRTRKPSLALSTAIKKTRDRKDDLIEKIRDCVDEFDFLYVAKYENMRSNFLKEVRKDWPSSRFFLGNNKVMQVALGKTPDDEAGENLCLVTDYLQGNVLLFFTNDESEKVLEFFDTYGEADFARSGFIATETRVLKAGPTSFEFSLEEYLRNTLKMPTALRNGIVHLEGDFTVCTEGQALTPEQARLLKLLDVKMSTFKLPLVCVWSKGQFKSF